MCKVAQHPFLCNNLQDLLRGNTKLFHRVSKISPRPRSLKVTLLFTSYMSTYLIPECDRGQWGPGCSQSCNSLCLSGSCDHVTGQCRKGCEPGYQEPNCTEGERCCKNQIVEPPMI